jgi:prepilin-type N-terminal cleavage/methylation domain-containing protein
MLARQKRGFSIVEILVASAILVTLVTAIGGGWQLYIKTVREGTHFTTASNLSEEGTEALKILRDNSWSSNIANLSKGVEYDFYWNGSSYITTTTPTYIQNIYRRTITLSSIYRDAWDNIISSGGSLDPDTLQVNTRIYRLNGTTTSMIYESYSLIHNTYEN